ncbi:MAG: lycopene cyclase family protein [Myxococcota bacterium]
MSTEKDQPRVVVIGSGPAGMLAASACAEADLPVAVVAPAPDAPWPNRYGVWADELEAVGLGEALDPVWPRTEVRLDGERRHLLDRAYGRVDGERLRDLLVARCRAGDTHFVPEAVRGVIHDSGGSRVETASGDALRASVVIDATGHDARFVRRPGPGATAFQTAWGVRAEIEGGDLDPATMTLMDFSDPGRGAPAPPDGAPTFLYAMPEGDGVAFLEETTLIGRPPASMETLRARLQARLARRGITLRRVLDTERCRIPMDAPLPDPDQRTVGFGGAASMVHPATGYMITRAATAAPALARTLARELGRGARPRDVSRAAWRTLWPPGARRRHAFYRLGAEVVLGLDAAGTRDFFDAFFSLSEGDQAGYLGPEPDTAALARAMLRMHAGMSPTMKLRLWRGVARAGRDEARRRARGTLPRSVRHILEDRP